ncbi:MAG: dephospho-CoA kinase [Candidatus Omnitrophica bacterium]|nr:dephospho-CoA kinase [Candidatus Omnitrophota bacterium]
MKKQNPNRVVLGITGSFGTGKSTVARMFKLLGAKVIDADRIAREAIKRDTGGYKKICALFGKEILRKNKEIDRMRLAEIVFKDIKSLRKLNSIVHPVVKQKILTQINKEKEGIIVLDAPLLIEANLKSIVDRLIVVTAKRATQIGRIQRKSDLDKASIIRRIRSQLPLKEKEELADFIIDNNSTLEKTREQVRRIYREFSRIFGN